MESGTITRLEVQKRNDQRVNVYLDDSYAFSLTLDEAFKLRKGQVLTAAEIEALRNEDDLIKAVDRAARFIAYRPRSEKEVRRNLTDHDVDEAVVDSAIERLNNLGYLDDRAFAAFWIKDRQTFKPASPRALRYELRQKGVADDIITECLAEVEADDAAYRAAQSQVRKLSRLDKQGFRTKLAGFLQRRGFSYSETRTAIERIITELEEENPDIFTSEDSADGQDGWAAE
jgi:regulatory protein